MEGDGSGAASAAHIRVTDGFDERRPDLAARLVDPTVRRPDRAHAVVGLSEQDLANLETLAEHEPRVRNHAVRIRRLLAREAKRVRGERTRQGTLGEALDELLNAEEPT